MNCIKVVNERMSARCAGLLPDFLFSTTILNHREEFSWVLGILHRVKNASKDATVRIGCLLLLAIPVKPILSSLNSHNGAHERPG